MKSWLMAMNLEAGLLEAEVRFRGHILNVRMNATQTILSGYCVRHMLYSGLTHDCGIHREREG